MTVFGSTRDVPGADHLLKSSPNIGSPLFESCFVTSSSITSQCSTSIPSWRRTISAAIQFTGRPNFENRPCTMTKFPSATIVPGSYSRVGGRLLMRSNWPSRPGPMCALLPKPCSQSLSCPYALARFLESLGYCREVGAHNLPLPALFDEDQGSSAMDRESLAVSGDSRKHVVSIYDPPSSLYMRHDGCRKPKLAESRLAMTR